MKEACPVCGAGRLRLQRVQEEMFGVDLGAYSAEVCDRCAETFFTPESVDRIEAKAKKLGLWGLASKVKVARSGNSLVVRIPSALARHLRLKSGQELMVSPERKDKLVLELA